MPMAVHSQGRKFIDKSCISVAYAFHVLNTSIIMYLKSPRILFYRFRIYINPMKSLYKILPLEPLMNTSSKIVIGVVAALALVLTLGIVASASFVAPVSAQGNMTAGGNMTGGGMTGGNTTK
jgi:hypothetical protein